MRLFPDTQHRLPAEARFWVHFGETDEILPTEIATEESVKIEKRFEHDFQVYRAVQVGKRMIAQLIGGGHEV